jgi:hypothetical protein
MIPVNLTLDLVPEIRVIVHREGEVFVAKVEEVYVEVEDETTETETTEE